MNFFSYPDHYQVIVIGAGHAGVEAALIAARLGCQTLVIKDLALEHLALNVIKKLISFV